MWNSFFLLCVVLLVEGAAVDVSVLEGDSVTLEADNITLKTDDWIRWKFNGIFICKMKKTGEDFIIKNDFDLDKKFIGRLEPNIKTGSLKITDITADHAGLYKVEMKSTTDTSKNYSVTVHGGERTMSVMEEKPITLDTSHIKIQGYDQILWEFEGQIIAEIDQRKNLFLHHDSRVERLKGRLQLDKNSGSLTISFSRKTDSGVYHLQMNSRSYTLQRNISVTVSDYSPPSTPPPGAAVDVSVLEGDSVTLEADNITLKTDDWIRWKFNGIFICKMKKTGEDFIIKNDFDLDKKFIGRLEPNIKTGSLKITDITADHAGLYKVEMKSTTDTSKNYIVTVNGREQTASVMEGYSVILRTGLIKIQGYDQIKWEFGDQIIAVINQKNNQLLFPNGDDKGRLQLTENSGSLNISRTKSTDSGVYHLQMNSRSHTLQRNIKVTVSDSSRIYASFGLVVWAVTLSLLQV